MARPIRFVLSLFLLGILLAPLPSSAARSRPDRLRAGDTPSVAQLVAKFLRWAGLGFTAKARGSIDPWGNPLVEETPPPPPAANSTP